MDYRNGEFCFSAYETKNGSIKVKARLTPKEAYSPKWDTFSKAKKQRIKKQYNKLKKRTRSIYKKGKAKYYYMEANPHYPFFSYND